VIETLGVVPGSDPAHLARVGFVAQDSPVYPGLSVADHLRLGAELNPGWDAAYARARIESLDLDPSQKAGKLSGGQRAQLALTIGLAKRPELLLLDEPVASLDPLARRDFFSDLMAGVAETGMSVVLSSHVISDLERLCDHLVVLARAEVRLVGDVDDLLAGHRRLTGPRRDPGTVPADLHVVDESHTDRQTTLVVRTEGPVLDPAWSVGELSLEDLVLTYLRPTRPNAGPAPLRSVS
jgi:ABC-2 type transport system ATP-binding protein